jgi:hypothetical protein
MGWIIAFCFWFIQVKLPSLGKEDPKLNQRINRLKRRRDMEAMNASRAGNRTANTSLSMSVIQEDANEYAP